MLGNICRTMMEISSFSTIGEPVHTAGEPIGSSHVGFMEGRGSHHQFHTIQQHFLLLSRPIKAKFCLVG